MALFIACISMYLVNPLLSVALLDWFVIFLGIAFLFYKGTLKLSAEFSESNSLCMGKLEDSVTNIVSAKLFARNDYEENIYQNMFTIAH